MAILEDHNRQLEAQLDRLRQLVSTDNSDAALAAGGGEVTKFVVAAQLHEGKGEDPVAAPPVHRRQPPTALDLPNLAECRRSNHPQRQRDSGTSGTTEPSNRDSATSGSLNLSQHNTESQVLQGKTKTTQKVDSSNISF